MSESVLPGWMAADIVPAHADFDWYVVRVMSNRERVVAGFLNGKGMEACAALCAQAVSGQMQAIMRLVESGLPLEPHPLLSEGERVRICSGPMTAVERVLIRVEPVKVPAHALRQAAMDRGL